MGIDTKMKLIKRINFKLFFTAVLMAGIYASTNASVCSDIAGGINCNSGTINSLSANGMATANGTTISGKTSVNGLFEATDSNLFTLEANGGVLLTNCTISGDSTISGTLKATSSKFEKDLMIYSNEVRFNNSKVLKSLHIGHTGSKKQVVYV